ncbi:MAG: bifunctional glutathionylspermidine amidase/synthase [Alphaproteobacteria bacterium]|nr:bifunctional glutathionylspermidine amidase/synthase [Alphaproteobacteria bacterium]HRW30184.1 bifunctional glutathionylspermidine amidase/synthase [Emcibacteraceae bacterium]
MIKNPKSSAEPFGAVLGYGKGDVPVFSSDYDTVNKEEMPDRRSFKSYVDGVFMGYKWQCVELARRWMYINHGYVFDDISMAYDIFNLREVKKISDGTTLPLYSFRNGSKRLPEPGALMIWNEGGEFEITGHVAVVTEVTANAIRIIEQNVDHVRWTDETSWSRELPMRIDADGRVFVSCTFDEGSILGWVMQTDDPTYAEVIEEPDPAIFNLVSKQAEKQPDEWLDISEPDQAAFVHYMHGHRMATSDEDKERYFLMGETARKEVKRATNELNAIFMRATDYVLEHEDILAKFNLPAALIPRIQQSWQNRKTHNITGRFDFALSEKGLKVYEYNADSASCYMECGLVQGKWAEASNVRVGRDAGGRLTQSLIDAWEKSHVDGVLHIMQDDDLEENYHALYMKRAIEGAGIKCKIIKGLDGLLWDDEGYVVDPDGERILWVWKTWAWETALDQLRDEAIDEEDFLLNHKRNEIYTHQPRLVDVLLRPDVMVFEPLWTLIPSNKAILPVLWMLFPDHPYLLESRFELTESLSSAGYVIKPIVGRCGNNISLIDKSDQVLAETGGKFEAQDQIYQKMFKLPDIDGLRVQVCSFSVDGYDAGVCVRCDHSLIIRSESDLLALRIVPDEYILNQK